MTQIQDRYVLVSSVQLSSCNFEVAEPPTSPDPKKGPDLKKNKDQKKGVKDTGANSEDNVATFKVFVQRGQKVELVSPSLYVDFTKATAGWSRA